MSKRKRLPFTGADVLREATIIVAEGGEEICPWCACAAAKGKLDDRYGVGLQGFDVLVNWFNEVKSDSPLIEAREALSPWENDRRRCKDFSRQESIAILWAAQGGDRDENGGMVCPPSQGHKGAKCIVEAESTSVS